MSMGSFTQQISQLVETQFPDIYREEGEAIVAFTKAYYEFLESDNRYAHKLSRQMFELRDIDTSMDEFLKSFKETYLADFPFKFKTDTKFAIKNIVNYYRSKGSKESLSLLMKLLFEEEVSVYYPGEDVLKLSDSEWYKPFYLEVTISKRNSTFLNKEITGIKSGAKAFVESIARKRIKGKIFDVLYLSSLRGNFIAGERITDDGLIANSPRVKGSLTSLSVILGGRDNSVGDVFDVITDEGKQGQVKVTSIQNATGRVDFTLVDGGWGFSNNSLTDVYLSDAILFVNNPSQSFVQYEKVYQPIEAVNVQSASDILSANTLIGKYIIGKNSTGTLVANGTIVAFANTFANGAITSGPSSNATLTILTTSGTFASQRQLILNSNSIGYSVGETITEESKVTIEIANQLGIFSNNEIVEQFIYNTYPNTAVSGLTSTLSLSNTIITVSSTTGLIVGQPLVKTTGTGAFKSGTTIKNVLSNTQIEISKSALTAGSITFTANQFSALVNYAYGRYVNAESSNTYVVLNSSWGTFDTKPNSLIVGKTSNANAAPVSVATLNANIGARGTVTGINNSSNSIIVDVVFGEFDTTKNIKGDKSNLVYTVNTNNNAGATLVYLEANNSSNGIISLANTAHIEGIVIGQNTTSVGIFGNTAPFFYSNAYASYIYTDRINLISPPRNSNNEIIELQLAISRIPGGKNANFEIGALSDIENVTIYSDIIGGTNVANVPYTQIQINGRSSGVGLVRDIEITSGGTGYTTNDRIVFLGGGFANGAPTVPASAFITCNANGTITDITVDVLGSGYYDTPTAVLPGNGAGDDAVLIIEMDYGYGFPKNPSAENGNLIADALNTNVMNVGRISLLAKINPGTEYTAAPFIDVRNRYISAYGRRDLILNVTNVTNGSFAVGEEITQVIGSSVSVKGVISRINILNGSGKIYLKRKTLAIAFTNGYSLVGSVTGARATLVEAISDEESNPIGYNAEITSEAISASGVATGLTVLNSGFGYVNNGDVILEKDGNQFIITAKTKTQRQGVSEGYWRTTSSHLNSEKKIHDNKYYQEYSYDVLSGLSLNRYERILKKVFHVAGTEMFGSVVKSSFVSTPTTVVESSITKIAM